MRQIGENLYVHEHPFRLYGLEIGTRMTVARLGGDLWLHSPVEVDDALAAEVEKLGKVAHLVAPSAVHHLFLEPWKERFPAAKLYGPRSLQKKRPDLNFDELLADEPPAAWGGAFEQRALEGTRYLKEIAFYHKQSRTLILTDHIFHFGDRWPLGTRIAMRAIGAYKKAAWPRDFGLIIKDRSALEAALKTVLAWDFDRIVISHGDIVEQDGKRALRDAYQMSNA